MAQVTVTIAGRVYRMACADGEEPHLEDLARSVDAKIAELHTSFGEIGDQRIIVMAALTFADELGEAKRRIAEMEVDLVNARQESSGYHSQNEVWSQEVADAIGSAASRIEGAAQLLSGPKTTM
ncbi:MAG: cell division protein ZapA [Hyphomicrobiales bacterium]|nr:cell division protein ZapA [Hyphomicrobiales bacterium]MDE2115694.1 cell division protein ZapA [Hyphomicrobiales bacterium]